MHPWPHLALAVLLPGTTAHALAAGRAGAAPARAPPPCMAQPQFIFELAEDRSSIKFGCRQQSVTMVKPEVFKKPTFKAFHALLDNYVRAPRISRQQ